MRIREYPGFLPGLVISIVIALALSGRVARWLGIARPIAWGLLFGLGIIVAATLTPGGGVFRSGAVGSGACEFSRVGLAPIAEVLRFGETGLNVLLFIPLGVSIGFLPSSRIKLIMIVGGIALPFLIELTQLAATFLDRQCQSADVIDNLTGLAIGLVVGSLARLLVRNG